MSRRAIAAAYRVGLLTPHTPDLPETIALRGAEDLQWIVSETSGSILSSGGGLQRRDRAGFSPASLELVMGR